MSRHQVKIVTGPDEPRFEVDGHNIARSISQATIHLGTGGSMRIEVEIPAHVIESTRLGSPDAEFMVNLPPGAEEALIALGWKPPTVGGA